MVSSFWEIFVPSWFLERIFNNFEFVFLLGTVIYQFMDSSKFYINREPSTLEEIGYITDIRLTSKRSLYHNFSLYLVTSIYFKTYTVLRVVFSCSNPGSTSFLYSGNNLDGDFSDIFFVVLASFFLVPIFLLSFSFFFTNSVLLFLWVYFYFTTLRY